MARSASYRNTRNYENLQKAMFWGVGEYDIPVLQPVKSLDVDRWVPFNFAKGAKDAERTGVHFFLDDYQFERVWKNPDVYTLMLSRFGAVCTPDFSPYGDFPRIVQIYNHYRKHWCGAYWQYRGLTVIPTITWGSEESLNWAFDGEPVGGIIATSSTGSFESDASKQELLDGYKTILERLEPTMIIWNGIVPAELQGDVDSGLIRRIETFAEGRRRSGVYKKKGKAGDVEPEKNDNS